MKCLQCESQDIVKDVEVFDGNGQSGTGNLNVGLHRDPKAMIFKNTRLAKVSGNVCAACGFLMLSVSKLDANALSKIKRPQK